MLRTVENRVRPETREEINNPADLSLKSLYQRGGLEFAIHSCLFVTTYQNAGVYPSQAEPCPNYSNGAKERLSLHWLLNKTP